MNEETTTKIANLSKGARAVLVALVETSAGNGHDFGFMDEARALTQFNRHQFAGYVSALGAFIAWSEDLSLDRGCECDAVQYKLTEECTSHPFFAR